MKNMKKHIVYYLLCNICLAGCGVEYQFNQAKKLEKNKNYVEAAEKYKEISDRYPKSKCATESLYYAGKIYQKKIKNYSESRKLFSELLGRYPNVAPWSKLAMIGIFDSPDYSPVNEGNYWREGDSATGGKNMSVEVSCVNVSTSTAGVSALIRRRSYAGKRFVDKWERYYVKTGSQLWELIRPGSKQYTILLDYPFTKGQSWKTVRGGTKLKLTIVDDKLTVKVRAGKFTDCLKIEEKRAGSTGVKYEYYAPEVGRILTTTAVSVGTKEYRSSELISYKMKSD